MFIYDGHTKQPLFTRMIFLTEPHFILCEGPAQFL